MWAMAIPIIGPLFKMITSIWTGAQNVDIEKYTVDGKIDVAAMQASESITQSFESNLSVNLARDLIMFPGSVWCGLYLWDKIMAHHYPWLVWDVAPLDGLLTGVPYALMTFFFGLSAMNVWRNK